MKKTARIRIADQLIRLEFQWLDFDGDDCFGDFHISIASANDTRRFDFGPCSVYGLRKLSGFFKDSSQTTVSGGFRHPDIRYYEVHRFDDGYRLIICFEESGLQREFQVRNPSTQIDDEFLSVY